MKIKTRFFLYSLFFFILNSCASRPVSIDYEPIKIAVTNVTPVLTPLEKAVLRVKGNGADIEKYFVIENRQIVVKSDLPQDEEIFEITYNLIDAKLLGDSGYEVGFTIREKDTDIINEDTLLWKPSAGDAGILLSFDDDYMETWEQYLDLFDKYGAKVTFFIMGQYDPFCTIALSRGHDVGFHTLNHLDLRSLSREDFDREAIISAESFRQEGIPVSSLAFPYGFSDTWMHEALLEHYSVLRGYGTAFRLYTGDRIGSAHIISIAIDNTVLQGEDNFDRTILTMLRTVKFLDKNWIVPMTSHDISNAAWAIRQRRLEFLLGAITDLKLKFYLYSDFTKPAISN